VRLRSRLAPALVATVVTCCSALAGCSGGDTDDTESTASSSSASTSAEETSASATTGSGDTDEDGGTDAPPFPANAEPDTADPSSDSRVTVTDIRVGRHDGFDRVVFEVDGTGTPGWSVQYVDDASSQGSGEPVDVEGDAVLQVVLTGVGYPYDTGVDEYANRDPVSAADTETVTEVVFDGTFEGQTVAFVGTSAEAPFRVYALDSPTRVVLEVADEG
jgi:hypothetical protein